MSDWKKNCAWYESAVFYHIYPLGMCGVEKHRTDFDPQNGVRQHFAQMEQLIPHMKRLGMTALYIGPCFESEGHGYETVDYYRVDARLGDNAGFRHFVDACHAADIRVVVDGVFNHSGRGFFAFEELRKHREGSPYRDWYCNVNFGGNNEFNDGFSYEAWHGYNILPRLNLWNPAVRGYLLDVIRFWVKEFDIDGIRLDCADVLNFDFMKEMRQLANTVKPEFWLMGEVIHGDYSRWVNHDTLHSVTNYELHKGLYSGHNDHNYFEIAHTIRRLFGNGGLVRDGKLYTFVENHDVNRLIDKVKDPAHMKNIYLIAYTLPGIPSVYYGGEFRMHGVQANGSDDGIRPAVSLSDYTALAAKEQAFVEFLAMLGRAKEELAALSVGSYEERVLTNRQFAYARVWKEQTVLVAANNDENPARVNIRAEDGEYVDFAAGKKYRCGNGNVSVELAAHDGIILVKGGWEFAGETQDVDTRAQMDTVAGVEVQKSAGAEQGNGTGADAAAEATENPGSACGRNTASSAANAESQADMDAKCGSSAEAVTDIKSQASASSQSIHTAGAAAGGRITPLSGRTEGHRFFGILIKESVNTEDILDEITVYGAELRRTDTKPRYRTALYFTADAEDFPDKLSRVMIADADRGGNWFADFRGGDRKYIVFRDKVFSYQIGDAAAKAAVCEECRKLGAKDEQMNWGEQEDL